MKDLIDRGLDLSKVLGATFSEVRIVDQRNEELEVKNGTAEAIKYSESEGIGVRVIVDGAWGFASTSRMEKKDIDEVTALAVQIAKASAMTKKENVVLSPADRIVADYSTPLKIDPFKVSLSKKVDLLLSAEKLMNEKGVRIQT